AEETDACLISTHIAHTYHKELGSKLKILKQRYVVTGIFQTDTPIDNVILVQEARVRELSEIPPESVSSLYVEIAPDASPDDVAARVRELVPAGVESRSTTQWGRDVNGLLSTLDPYL